MAHPVDIALDERLALPLHHVESRSKVTQLHHKPEIVHTAPILIHSPPGRTALVLNERIFVTDDVLAVALAHQF